MDNFQDILNNYSSIDPSLGMTQGGVSDTSALVQDAVANYKPMPGSETLSDSLKRISEMNLKSFGEIYLNTPDSNVGNGVSLSLNNSRDIGAQLFPPDTSESLWKDIDIDQYYTRMSDSWDSIDKDNASMIGIGGGVATGAATGAAIGSLVGPVGTAVGAVVGGILGGIEGSQVAENIGYGYVRNSNGVNENSMYQQQGFFGRAGAGLMKLTHNANGMVLGTLATVSGIPKALAEKSFTPLFDNKFAKLLDDYDNSSNSSNIIYGSSSYKDSSLLGQTLHSEFWFDKVAPGVGFMLGAVAGGRGASYLLKPLGMGGKVAGSTRAMLRGTAAEALASGGKSLTAKALIRGFSNAVRDDLRKTTIKSLAGNFTSLLTSAAPESALEARGAMNEAREQYIESYKQYFGANPTYEELNKFEEQNKTSANGVFTANLAVVGMSNLLQFGDALGLDKVVKKGLLDEVVDKAFGLGVRKTLGEVSEKGIQSAVWNTVARTTGQKVGYRVFKALESPLTEGVWEEGIQSVISGTHKNYLESRFNPRATEINKSILKSFGESFAHTYGSREGWDEILVGMIIGAGGTVMGNDGFLEQKGISRREAQDVANAENLNKTQVDFIKAQEDYLSKQSIYNNLNNTAIRGVQDKIGALNQQIIGTEASKTFIAEGNLEQAGLAYRNALFAKLSAERRAGISDSSKFNMEMMLENIPDENLIELGFTTPESRDKFKEDSLRGLNELTESFDIAYKAAEQLDLGTGTTDFSPAQITEAAALHLFHGMHAGATANTIAQSLEGVLGTTGVASALNYYSNISEKNKERIQKVKDNLTKVQQLEEERNKLLSSYSTQLQKISREVENEANTRAVDLTDDKINALNSEIEALQNESASLTKILQDKANMPKLPFGNEAYKFFDSVGLQMADSDVNSVLDSLDSIDRYLDHLEDTTGKTPEEIEIDNNKIEMVSSLLDTYKRQMALMRNFAKMSQMVGDKAYTNNMAKSIFNKRKYDAIFDNDEWINNNESGFSEAEKDTYNKLKEKVASGEISKYDFHTYLTNAEILRMNAGIKSSKTIEDLQQESLDIDNSNKPPIINEAKAKSKERLKKIRDTKLEELQDTFWSGVDMGAAIAADRWSEPIENEKLKNPFVDVLTLTKGEKIIDSKGEVKVVDNVVSDLFETVITFQDGSRWIGDNSTDSTWKVEKQLDKPNSKSETSNVTPFSELLTQYEIEVDKIEAQYNEAIAQIDVPTNEIATALDKLNNAINSIVENVISRGRTINKEYVDSFGQEDSLLEKEVLRVQTLLNKGVLSMEETNELNSLLEKVNSYGAVEGRVSDSNGTPIRLSDLLEQRAQLETEFFNDKKSFVQLTEEEMKGSTFDSQEDDVIPSKEGQALGDAAVLNSYDFSTFTPLEDSYQISNITPEGFTSKLIGENDADVFIRKPDGAVIQVSENWDDQVAPGDTVSIELFTGDATVNIDFSVDTSRRVLLPQYLRDVIHDHSDLRFEDKNQIGSTAHYVLTTNNNGVEVYLGSDFDVELDSKATQDLNPGEPLFFEYDADSDWNLNLEKKYKEAHPDPDVIEYYDKLMSLVNEYGSANTERRAEIKRELSTYLPHSGDKIPQFRSTINKDRNSYMKSFSTETKDSVRREFKNSMRIVAVDKNGNRVGVVKSLSNSSVYGKGREKMDHLRAQLFEDLEKSDFIKTKSKFSTPIQIVYMGIPNIKSNDNGKITYRFSNIPGDNNIDPKLVKSIGYVSYETMIFKDGRKVNTPYNYAKKLMNDTRNKGVNIPVILFEYAGKEIIYPINLIEKNSEPLIERLNRILELEGTVSLSETISAVNKLLAENGVDKSVRVTSLNYAQDIQNAVEVVSNIPNIPTLTEIMESDNFRDVLETSAIIDINIKDTPFVGPKIRFDITQVPEFNSDIIEESTPEFSIDLEEEINNDKENKSCLE